MRCLWLVLLLSCLAAGSADDAGRCKARQPLLRYCSEAIPLTKKRGPTHGWHTNLRTDTESVPSSSTKLLAAKVVVTRRFQDTLARQIEDTRAAIYFVNGLHGRHVGALFGALYLQPKSETD
ncbi:hypothetical protein ABBQ32_008837 [Trebouxia sp. C0010 RCD-2024]